MSSQRRSRCALGGAAAVGSDAAPLDVTGGNARAALDARTLPSSLRRTLLPVRNTRRITKKDMAMHDALPSTWVTGEEYDDCPLAAYGVGQ